MTTYQDRKTGARVETDMSQNNEDDFVHFFPQGGGFQYKMPHAKFHEIFELATGERPWRLGWVSAEWLGEGVELRCYSNGDLWNGWTMPYLPRESIEQLQQALDVTGGTPLQWMFGDKAVAADMGEGEIEVYEKTFMPDGTPAWPVGAGSWTWESIRYDEVDYGQKES